MGSIPESGRSPGGRHGNPLQYSCLENPMKRGAWQATVHGVTKSRTPLKGPSTHTHSTIKLDSSGSQACFNTWPVWGSTSFCWRANSKEHSLHATVSPWWVGAGGVCRWKEEALHCPREREAPGGRRQSTPVFFLENSMDKGDRKSVV